MLTGYFLAATHDSHNALVVNQNFMLHSALAAEVQHGAPVVNKTDVTVAKRGEPETLVVPGIFAIADANPGSIEQADYDRQNFFPRQAGQRQIALEHAAQLRQLFAERHHAAKLCTIAQFAPFGVIAILLASARVPSGCL